MTKKIEIPERILEDLYLIRDLSTYKIAEKFNCDPTVIQKRLKDYNIKLRKPKKKIIISKERLFDLYINKKFSTQKISKILEISSCTVYNRLIELNIPIRCKNIVKIDRKELKELYIEKNLSCSKIGKMFDCDKVTIFKKLKKFNLNKKNLSQANTKYSKKKFDGDNKLKAYMIGFRLGDLNVKAINENSTIFVKSSTTKEEQYNLIKEVYGKYGHFKFKFNNDVYGMYCNLDKSFSFLLPKKDDIESWILEKNCYFFAFLGGYADAEGNFGVYQNRARFRLGTYDKNILMQIKDRLNSLGIITRLNLEGKAVKGKNNQDFYRLSVNEKESLLRLIKFIRLYIKHKKRCEDMILVERNILERNKNKELNINL